MCRPSSSDRFLAAVVDPQSNDLTRLLLHDIKQNRTTVSSNLVRSCDWDTKDTLYYTELLEGDLRPYRVWSSSATDSKNRTLVYEEHDPRFFVDIHRTKDEEYLVITSTSKTQSRALVMGIDSVSPRLVVQARSGVQEFIEHVKGHFYMLSVSSNQSSISRFSLNDDSSKSEVVVPNNPNISIMDAEFFRSFMALHVQDHVHARSCMRIYGMEHSKVSDHFIDIPDRYCSISPGLNENSNTSYLQLTLSSPVDKPVDVDYDVESQQFTSVIETDSKHTWEKLEVPGHDNVMIPITILSGTVNRDPRPVLLTVYGAYGENNPLEYSPHFLPLLDDGWNIVITHVRGGSERGHQWHADGCRHNKLNSMHDYVSCAEYVISSGMSTPELLVGYGASAAGVVLGATANTHAHLFRGMLMHVPFVNVLGSMMDSTLALTEHEYDEWGNPTTDEYIQEYIRGYDPTVNIRPQNYPAMYITSSTLDRRAEHSHISEYVNRLRQCQQDSSSPITLITDMEYGHMGAAGTGVFTWKEMQFLKHIVSVVG